ncbi:MAG: caspase family protein, partial [Nonlabens sp.]
MPRKLALLIGVSDYGEGFDPLSAPVKDVAALQRVLANPEMGHFDEVKTLTNPGLVEMRREIGTLFSTSQKDDLVLLFFSGHGVTDDDYRLYLTTKASAKDTFKFDSLEASYIQNFSDSAYAKRQVIILDCCYSGAFAGGWQPKGAEVKLELERELGKEGRVVLTSSSSTQVSFQQEDGELSLYTQYLVEGMETGAADKENHGAIRVRELHEYAKRKVQAVKPKLKPDIIVADDEGYDIVLSRVKVDAALRFRRVVEKYADPQQGEIRSRRAKEILETRARNWGLTTDAAAQI